MARQSHIERQTVAYEAAMAWKRDAEPNRLDANVTSLAEVHEPPPKARQLPDLSRYGWFGHGCSVVVCEDCSATNMGKLDGSRCLICALKLHGDFDV